jgi:hypothetical protein
MSTTFLNPWPQTIDPNITDLMRRHRYRIIAEPDATRRQFYLSIVELTQQALARTYDMMGISVPWRM